MCEEHARKLVRLGELCSVEERARNSGETIGGASRAHETFEGRVDSGDVTKERSRSVDADAAEFVLIDTCGKLLGRSVTPSPPHRTTTAFRIHFTAAIPRPLRRNTSTS